MVTTEELSSANYKEIAGLAIILWPDSSLEEEEKFFRKSIPDHAQNAFLLKVENILAGFVSLSLRTEYVEGSSTKPVCYIEGIFVASAFRKKGYAQMLVKRAEEWGKQMGCTEIASDTEVGNLDSLAFHKRMGFREVNRVVCFVREIS
ncbi:aminoglycoside 6'-N-acetyltransferase I [Muriicola jejuensis]|uniref:Aminoglycoside N(6')-acetyltransferase type 1 n=1 Tax=Muriicola jejuensis TaxID=504488 RepID=A0A6P0UD30_9FLAO|nr:aminoglycoside 6'-N-acetyltransferase [Muriicola jejuensis]NER09819.1 GNAT family N-acetyltransferase [Muriicola jejuensis]SMP05450.1 aminoglycoside 6'-N-acetyltransferase I [Muriicola jejuensis]